MHDERLVPSLIYGLESRFLFLTWSWCNSIACKDFGFDGMPRGRKDSERVNAMGAFYCRRILPDFFFSWLVMTEHYARKVDEGVVRRKRFDDAMVWGGGQFLYDLFASRCIRGPYVMPWDNAYKFRESVLKPAVGLMRSYEHDDTLIFPPEAKQLLELRGLKFDF